MTVHHVERETYAAIFHSRRRASAPRIARTDDKTILLRPENKARGNMAYWTEHIKMYLPGFTWNSRKGWWEGPLSDMQKAKEILYKYAGGPVDMTDGAREYLKGDNNGQQTGSNK